MKIKKVKLISFSSIALSLFLSLFTFDNQTSAVTVNEVQARIQALQAQLAQSNQSTPTNSSTSFRFTTNLFFGMRNSEAVRQLQSYLINKNLLPVSANTGNYYSLTQRAVRNFQVLRGLPATGYFGPRTRELVNAELDLIAKIGNIQAQLKVVEKQEAEVVSQPQTNYQVQPKPTPVFDNLARLVQDYVNLERTKNGLQPLAWDGGLASIGELHSQDQALDNREITNPDILCHYPLIRHEGIRGGYSLRDRLEAGAISYRTAGENIVMFSTTKNLLYLYDPRNPPTDCPQITPFPPASGPREERLALFNQVLTEARNAVMGLPKVTWVNKEWRTEDESARKAVELWMDSAGHRENILRSAFNYGGIGVAQVNDYLIITHNFAGR